ELFEEWKTRDPIDNYQSFLLEQGILNDDLINAIRKKIKKEIEAGMKAFADPPMVADTQQELSDVYAPAPTPPAEPAPAEFPVRRFIDAITEGLCESMERHPQLVLMGQDIAGYGGVFKVTEGLMQRFGEHRVRNTPLCEAAV